MLQTRRTTLETARVRRSWRMAVTWLSLTAVIYSGAPPVVAQGIEVLDRDVPRHALVIGNEDYAGDTRDLSNAIADAELIGESLKNLEFEVTTIKDATQTEMTSTFLEFARGLPRDGIALVFFAGHGVQYEGENYLIPVDANPDQLSDLQIVAFASSTLMTLLDKRGSHANIFIFDACRNNPFETAANRTFGEQTRIRGLAPTKIRLTGNLVAYSTAPGEVSSDGIPGQNSPYAAALAVALSRPGLGIESVFKLTRSLVIGETNHAQVPWENSSLTQDIFLLPDTENAALVQATPCDIEAGHPSDPDRVVPGIDYALLRPAIAIPACRNALADEPSNPRLMTQLARALLKAGEYEEALELNHRAANLGYIGAYHNIGNHYKRGSGVARDMDTALEWFLKAAEQGHPEDAYNSGVIYTNGTDTLAPDYERARIWLERAASQDYPTSFDKLGLLYRNGLGVEQDDVRANELFDEGASLGDASAMVNLGNAYLKGLGVTADYDLAYDFFERAARLKRRSAYTNLGDMYRRGQGRAANAVEAAFWYGLAAFQGHRYSQERFSELIEDLPEATRADIDRRIEQWTYADFG